MVERRAVHRSPIILTPYASELRIDTAALSAFIEQAYAGAGWTPDMVDSGAVITTGEAARKENAAAIVALFSGQAGKFVCATAGHHLESLLAAKGSGAVALSRMQDTPIVLNVDIGGGTTKLAVCRNGQVEETAALDVGARVLSWGEDGALRTLTRAGARLARDAGASLSVGARPERGTLDAIADRIADMVMRVPGGRPMEDGLWLNPWRRPGPLPCWCSRGAWANTSAEPRRRSSATSVPCSGRPSDDAHEATRSRGPPNRSERRASAHRNTRCR